MTCRQILNTECMYILAYIYAYTTQCKVRQYNHLNCIQQQQQQQQQQQKSAALLSELKRYNNTGLRSRFSMYGVTFPRFFKGSVLLVNTLTPSPVLHSQNYFLAFSSDIIFSNKFNQTLSWCVQYRYLHRSRIYKCVAIYSQQR